MQSSTNMGGTMKSKEKKRSKLVIILLAPFKVLRKAGEFYMKFMADSSDMVGDDYHGLVGEPGFPQSFSNNSKRESSIGYSTSGRRSGPLQSASGRRGGVLSESAASARRSHVMQPNMHCREAEGRRNIGSMSNGIMEIRSYSVGIGKIGKIDEEKPCSFREDDGDNIKVDVCPRSRSQAVTSERVWSIKLG
ncbi:hypothetical protein NC652_003034 [Populus alba x Populus x berolinensis]|nr:hypothetical protein NC652_003034 [Populus alba x Populus x berolinensis]